MELPDRRVKAIFDEALEIDLPGERAAYLDQACAEMPDLRSKVEGLLKAFVDAGSFMSLSAEKKNLTVDGGMRPGADAEATSDQKGEQASPELSGEGPGTRLGRPEWKTIVGANPFPNEAKRAPSHLVVMVLKTAPQKENLKALRAAVKGPEIIRSEGKQLYIVYPAGIGRSKLTHALIEQKLGSRGTGRNWNTVLKLAALCE